MRRDDDPRGDRDSVRLARPASRFPPKQAPEMPTHYEGFDVPAPCGLPVDAWASRTNIPQYVTCPACRAATPGPYLPPGTYVNAWPQQRRGGRLRLSLNALAELLAD